MTSMIIPSKFVLFGVKLGSDIKKAFVSIGIQGLIVLMAGLEPARREAGDGDMET